MWLVRTRLCAATAAWAMQVLSPVAMRLRAQIDSAALTAGAARLHLFATRAAVSRQIAVRADQIILDPLNVPMPDDAAISVLAHMPKPVVCSARLAGDVVAISCQPLSVLPPSEQDELRLMQTGGLPGRPFLWFVRDHHSGNVDTLRVICEGRGWLVVTVGQAEKWYDDFYFRPQTIPGQLPLEPNYGVQDPARELPFADTDSAEMKARAEGAVAVISFDSPADDKSSAVIALEPVDSDQEEAVRSHLAITPQVESSLVKIATLYSNGLPQRDSAQNSEVLPRLATFMQQVWKGRKLPSAVSAFVRRFAGSN